MDSLRFLPFARWAEQAATSGDQASYFQIYQIEQDRTQEGSSAPDDTCDNFTADLKDQGKEIIEMRWRKEENKWAESVLHDRPCIMWVFSLYHVVCETH